MRKEIIPNLLLACALFIISGCATLDVTPKKQLLPAGERQGVTLGIQAVGDRLAETLDADGGALVKTASAQMFGKVVLLPKEARLKPLKEVQSAYGVDYVLGIGIGDISVSGDLNPLWFASLPLLFFKVYAPIVTFQPGVALDVVLRDARTEAVLMQKQVTESSSDHYAPSNPGEKVRRLISLTINNALVTIFGDTQRSIAAARQSGK